MEHRLALRYTDYWGTCFVLIRANMHYMSGKTMLWNKKNSFSMIWNSSVAFTRKVIHRRGLPFSGCPQIMGLTGKATVGAPKWSLVCTTGELNSYDNGCIDQGRPGGIVVYMIPENNSLKYPKKTRFLPIYLKLIEAPNTVYPILVVYRDILAEVYCIPDLKSSCIPFT